MLRWGCAAAAVVVGMALVAGPAAAQSSSQRQVSVPFAGPTGGTGYTGGTIGVTYSFIACAGEIHIAYSLNGGSTRASSTYLLDGKSYPATGAAPNPSTIRFSGTVYRGPEPVGSFADGLAGAALGMGCFSGQTQQVGVLSRYLGERPTQDQVTNFLNSLSLRVNSAETLRNGSLESSIRAEARRQQAEAEAAKRRAEQEQQAKARAEAEARAQLEAKARAEAQARAQAQQQQQQQQQAQRPMTPAGVPSVRPPPPPQLSAAERANRAIESDRILAQQRLAEQQRIYQQQQANIEAERQRQLAITNQMIAAAPGIYGALESVTDSIDAAFARAKANRWADAQKALAGKCRDGKEGNWPIPKDGELTIGVRLSSELSTSDCGDNPNNRFEVFRLDIPEPMRVRITGNGSMWMNVTLILATATDPKRVIVRYDAEATGILTSASAVVANLQPGAYMVIVHNAPGAAFKPFSLLAERVDARGKVIPWSPPAPKPPPPPPPPGPMEHAVLGLWSRPAPDGQTAEVTQVAAGGVGARAGLQVGDRLQRIYSAAGSAQGAATFIDGMLANAYLDRLPPGSAQDLLYFREGQLRAARIVTPR